MKNTFLLVTGEKPDRWAQTVVEALSPIGLVEITTQEKSLSEIEQNEFALVIIDSTFVTEWLDLISRFLARNNNIRLVVATLSPTWKRALKALQAGAMDYFPKTMNKEELRRKVESVLEIPIKGSSDPKENR